MKTRWLVPVVSLAVLASCEMTRNLPPSEGSMLSVEGIHVRDVRVLWEVVRMEVERTGFQLDREATDVYRGEFETLWRLELAPFRYQGRRKKILGHVREEPEGSGRFTVRLTVWVQKNADIHAPMDPTKADWQNTEPDAGVAEELLRRISRHFRPGAERKETP